MTASQVTQLLLRVYFLEEKLRKDPPRDPLAIAAAIDEIAALWDQINSLGKQGQIKPTDIEAAHARNQSNVADPNPQQSKAVYAVAIDGEFPGDGAALEMGYKVGDYVHLSHPNAPPKWGMQPANLLPITGLQQDHKIRG